MKKGKLLLSARGRLDGAELSRQDTRMRFTDGTVVDGISDPGTLTITIRLDEECSLADEKVTNAMRAIPEIRVRLHLRVVEPEAKKEAKRESRKRSRR